MQFCISMKNENYITAMQIFKQRFIPASTANEADEKLSTAEIFMMFDELIGDEEIKQSDIYQLMADNNFTYCNFSDGFKWLLKINR